MQRVKPSRIVSAAIFSVTLMLVGTGVASENSFVFIPQADSPGNEYSRVRNSSFEDCTKRCDAQNECNAFTYNQRQGRLFPKALRQQSDSLLCLCHYGGKTRSVVLKSFSPTAVPCGRPALLAFSGKPFVSGGML